MFIYSFFSQSQLKIHSPSSLFQQISFIFGLIFFFCKNLRVFKILIAELFSKTVCSPACTHCLLPDTKWDYLDVTCLLSSFFTLWDGGYVSVAQAALTLNKGWPWTHSLGLSSLELTVTFLSAGMTWSWTLTCKFIVHPDTFHSHSPITSFSASTESRRQELWPEDESLPSLRNWDQLYGQYQRAQSVSESCSLSFLPWPVSSSWKTTWSE